MKKEKTMIMSKAENVPVGNIFCVEREKQKYVSAQGGPACGGKSDIFAI